MKKILLMFSMSLLTFQMNAQCGILGVEITSVLVNPSGAGFNNFDTDGDGNSENDDEFVEICNNSAVPVDISGWTLGNQSQTFTFPAGTTLANGDCVLLVGQWDGSATIPSLVFQFNSNGNTFNNNGGLILLSNGINTCTVSYGNGNCIGSNCDNWADIITDGCPLLSGGVDCGYIPTPLLGGLPVELTSFESKVLDNNSVILFWQTASELNNSHFVIEHSRDGERFKEIGRETGKGTTTNAHAYSMKHERLAKGHHYYRLKQVDYDGKYEYSNILSAELKLTLADVSIAPNPAMGKVTIFIDTPISIAASYQLVNMQKEVMLEKTIARGNSSFEIDMTNLPGGVYFMRFYVDQQVIAKKIVKLY
ncbi:MAG: lamin tail domain-containing protein [Saprospiraceae bacterium]